MAAVGTSWGRLPGAEQRAIALHDRGRGLPGEASMLPWGNGRSYGDVARNDGGCLLATRGLDRFIAFDPATGVVECEAGVLLSEVIELALPQGWFPTVTPGTRFVTLGGAVANDVHGKNHHREGSFGDCLLGFELLRSDGSRLRCSRDENADWFRATVGGLGLTGLITRLRFRLRRVRGPWLRGDNVRYGSLAEFFAIARESDERYEYTVSWIDCAASGANLGRGIYSRAGHAPTVAPEPSDGARRMPLTPPLSLVNPLSIRAFNALYWHRPAAELSNGLFHWRPFFYPLDGILEWNRLYGPRGFYQYQCVVPLADAESAIGEMLRRIARAGEGSFLAVLKRFGERAAPGLLSFPRPGATLALDFPNRGTRTLALLDSLDQITLAAGGAVYPAKDARMSAAAFQRYYPAWREFAAYVDPKFSSSFWRRVTETRA
jgi:FAD/FMN-containing dehydrogenase